MKIFLYKIFLYKIELLKGLNKDEKSMKDDV